MVTLITNGILFDLDGTLINSAQAIDTGWKQWAKDHNLDGDEVTDYCHGRRTLEVFQHFTPDLAKSPEFAIEYDGTVPTKYGHLVKAIPGAKDFLTSLPKSQWGIVTSGSTSIASK